RTTTIPVNVGALERFDDGVEVTPDLLKAAGVVRRLKHPVKILGEGELTKRLTVHAHGFSKAAREAIEKAGGQAVAIGGTTEEAPAPKKARAAKPAEEPAADEPEAQDEPAAEEDAAADEPAESSEE
ncbi:MAG: uL15 family ribosomal protein, partial [Gaiellales bacterium]